MQWFLIRAFQKKSQPSVTELIALRFTGNIHGEFSVSCGERDLQREFYQDVCHNFFMENHISFELPPPTPLTCCMASSSGYTFSTFLWRCLSIHWNAWMVNALMRYRDKSEIHCSLCGSRNVRFVWFAWVTLYLSIRESVSLICEKNYISLVMINRTYKQTFSLFLLIVVAANIPIGILRIPVSLCTQDILCYLLLQGREGTREVDTWRSFL